MYTQYDITTHDITLRHYNIIYYIILASEPAGRPANRPAGQPPPSFRVIYIYQRGFLAQPPRSKKTYIQLFSSLKIGKKQPPPISELYTDNTCNIHHKTYKTIHIYIYIYTYTHISIHLSLYTCVYIYIYIYTQ